MNNFAHTPMTTYYKFLTENNTGKHSKFDYSDYLPKRGKPGAWMPKVEHVKMCQSGYHVCERKDLMEWRNAKLFIVELRGDILEGDDKSVGQEMRFMSQVKGWNDKNLRLAAADIVEHIALPIYKKSYPNSTIIEDTIKVIRQYANGNATYKELSAVYYAAGDAAWAAAEDATKAAAEDAAWAAARAATRDAAWAAAWAAAGAAAWAAAGAAAGDAAKAIICKRCGVES